MDKFKINMYGQEQDCTLSGLMIAFDEYKKGLISLETFINDHVPIATDPKDVVRELEKYYETVYMPYKIENKNW